MSDLLAYDAATNLSVGQRDAVDALRERLERSRVVIGDCALYCEDCELVLSTLRGVDAVVTDPPYGIGAHGGVGSGAQSFDNKFDWDKSPISERLMAQIMQRGKRRIIFGANYYRFPPATRILIWDKQTSGDFGDCELAWTDLDGPIKRIKYLWNGGARHKGETRGDHPTQKPVGVMMWCIGLLPGDCHTILDPFMGSGTTGVACVQMGRKFIGIERERKYFDAACRRIENACAQPRLDFPEPQRQPVLNPSFEVDL